MHKVAQTPRRRIVFIALILALAIGGAGQPAPAQAAPVGKDDISFQLEVFPENLPTICVKQKLRLYVAVSKTVHKVINGKNYRLPRRRPEQVAYGGSVTGANIGTLERQIGFADEENPVDTSTFIFTADRPGTTTLTFTAQLTESPAKLEKEVPVTVRRCKFKVTILGQWHVPGPGNIFFAAISDDAEVRAADAQGPYTGSATVNWVGSVGQVEDCSGAITIGSSQVNWTGEMDDSGQLTLNGTYQPAAGSVDAHCVGSSGETIDPSISVELTPDPLQVSLASSGGVSNQSQVLEGPEATPGFATIIVIPEEDEAVAFNADKPVSWVGSPSLSWWAVRGADFPWIFGASVGLAMTYASKSRKRHL